MPRSRTLAQLRADVRTRVDMVGSTWAVDADINEWINQAWAELYDLLTDTGEKYYLTNWTFSTVAGQDTYPLPADHYKTLGVDANIQGTQWFNLRRYQFEQRNDYNLLGVAELAGASIVNPMLYDLRGGNLHFIPPMLATVRHFYYPVAGRMVNDTDTIDGVNGWELFAINYAAKMLAERDDNFELAGVLTAEMMRLRDRITTMASDRNAGEAPKVRVSRGRAWVPGLRGRWWPW